MTTAFDKKNQITEGVIWRQLLIFFFPILIGTFFQQLYNTVDTVIVGQFVGKEALASVGGSSAQIVALVVGFFTGLSSGASVTIAQFFGAKDARNTNHGLHNAYAIAIAGGILFTVIGLLSAPALLNLMNTPAEIMHDSIIYLRVYFAGIIFVLIYNMGSAILRATGDSRRPLYYLIICCAINIVLDALFVIVFHMGVLGAAVLFSCMHVVLEWERTVVLRFGKFNRVAGPGLIFMIPFVEYSAATVDLRMRSTAFKAEHVLTSDLVPVDVDAVLFWMVWDAGKACSEIRNYDRLVYWVAQTTLRDVMGGVGIAQMGVRRTQIDKEVASILERKTSEWGITIVSVEIRDIEIPADLQEALSAEARAEREYNARIILAEVEKEVSEMFVDAARTYKKEDAALQLRAMSFVADSVKEKGGLVVVPSALSEAFEGLEKIAKG